MSASRRLRSRVSPLNRSQRFRLLAGVERLEDRSMLAAFVPGNFAVYRVGDGLETLSDKGNSVFVDEYTPSGDRVQTVAMAADTVNAGNTNTLIAQGGTSTSVSEGMMTRATDGRSLAVPGYTVAIGSLANTTSRRVVGLVGVDANVDLSTTGLFNQNGNFRGAFRNGDRIYTSGAAGGVVMVTKGTTSGSTLITDIPAQTRSVAVSAGQLYVSHASGSSSLRIGSVGSGVPTTGGQTTTSLPGFPSTTLPYQFFLADLSSSVAGVDTLYVADDTSNGGEIQKFSLVGGNWTANGAILAATVRGLTAKVSGSSVMLFGATGSGTGAGSGSLYTFTDTTGYNAAVSGTATTIASAGAKTAFRGVALVPDDGLGAIGGLSGSEEYSTGEEPILLGESATVSDQSNFKGGSLTVSYTSGGTSDDTISIADGNKIVAASGSVFFNGVQIGTYPTSGAGSGKSGNSLTVTFNAVLSEISVSAAAIQALLRRIAFGTGAAAAGGDRQVQFQVQQNDGQATTAAKTVHVTRSNSAPTANSDSVTTDEDQAKGITLTADDVDGDSLAFTVTSGPSHGTLSGTAPELTYTPDANYHGDDSFTFRVTDGTIDSNEATISITVVSVNDAPTAADAAVATDEDTPLIITLTGGDIDGDSLTFVVTGLPQHGSLSGTAPNLTYTPDPDFNGSDSFTFKVNDGTVDSSEATIDITVHAVDDPPTAQSAEVETPEDNATDITLVGNDVDGDELTYIITSDPEHGTLSGIAPNLVYTPDSDYHGLDSFTFAVNDGKSNSNEATISITILPINDPPIALAGELSTSEDTSANGTLSGTDADGDTLTFSIVSEPSHGTLTSFDSSTGDYTYEPAADYNGPDSFTFRVNDGKVDSSEAVVALTVTPVNDAPLLDKTLSPELDGIAEDVADPPGTLVTQLLAGVSDVDGGVEQGIAVISLNKAGVWQYSLDGGLSWLDMGLPTESAALVLRPTDLVRLIPKRNFNGTAVLYFRAWDQSDGATPGSSVDLVAKVGGTTAYSKAWDTAALTVTPVNDAPLLDKGLSPELDAIAEDAADPAGTLVSQLLAGVSDVDDGAEQGIAVISLNKAGVWQYSLDGGLSWLDMGLPTESAAIVLRPTDLVRLIPKRNFNGTAVLYFRAWDQSDGATPGSTVDLVAKVGGTTAYSKAWDTAALAVTPVNDAPLLDEGLSPELDDIAEDAADPAGTLVSQLLAGVSDVDDGAEQGIAVISLNKAGDWQYSRDGGLSWLDMGLPTESAALVLRPTDLVRLIPKRNFNGTAVLYFRAWDQSDGATPGSTVDLVGNVGGTTAYSKGWDTAALTVTPVNDAPLLGGINGTMGYALDAPPVLLASSATVSDVDSADFAGGLMRVAVTDGGAAANLLALSGAFTVDESNQVFLESTLIGMRTSNGIGLNDLMIQFNANVTPTIAQQLIRSTTFSTSGGVAGVRKIAFSISDGSDTSSELTKSVNVTLS